MFLRPILWFTEHTNMLQTQKPDINRMQHRQTHTHTETPSHLSNRHM